MIYTKNKLKEISFPLGGIGTGSIGLAGNGSLIDWEIFNKPNKGSLNGHTHFAVRADYPDGKSITKILQGDWIKNLIGQYSKVAFGGFGYGPFGHSMCAFPHFKKVKFDGKFPIATIIFEDDNFPAKVTLKAFNPFIPLDADNSSIPAAFFEIKIKSQEKDIKYTVAFSVHNPFKNSENQIIKDEKYAAIQLKHAGKSKDNIEYGDLTVATDCKNTTIQEYWFRGAWKDKIATFWHEITENNLHERHYDDSSCGDMCTLAAQKSISKDKIDSFRFVLSWNIPNNYNYWNPLKDDNEKNITWKNYYATLFSDSSASAFYSLDNWNSLYKKTNAFCKSLFSTTLDRKVIEAISATICVLKSPTVLRLEDGTFYGWEGVHEQAGSCEGTCTHVWSYAYALCFLFPELEKSLRNSELKYDTDSNGRMYFRTALPLGRGYVVQPPCVDGQMATIIKIYRDWKITGDSIWLKENWGKIKKILEYSWNENNEYKWDLNKDGVLEGRQHHTLDMELFGPSSWLQGMYLAALKAASEMAEFLGENEKKKEYETIFQKGYEWTKNNLFNGEYFFHKIDLGNKKYSEEFGCPDYWNEEKQELKYQIGEGSIIDQMLGQWHANICGLGNVFDKTQIHTALKNMMKNNFKKSLREFANPWRVFALNDEAGTVICDYPDGSKKPIIPIPYCEECMTGFEYSFAGLLISEGFIDEGLEVVRAIRDRYDGEKRNPWNEIECGSNYARPMSSFALLPIFSGFEFDVPNKHMGFSPIVSGNFKCMWNLGCGWGDFIRCENKYRIIIADGTLVLKSITLGDIESVKSIQIDGKEISFTQKEDGLFFEESNIKKEVVIEV